MTLKSPRFARVAGLLAFSGVNAGFFPVFAQGTQAMPPSPLRGPTVTDRNVPGAAPDFGMGPGANGRRAERVPPDVFRRALGVLTSDDAPAAIRATPAQRAKIREFVEGFEESARAFRREHSKEIESLRRAAGEAGPRRGRASDRPPAPADAPAPELTPEQQKARDEARMNLRELMAAAPKMEDVYTKAWAELSEPQREAVEARLDEWREEQSKRREDEYVRRRSSQKVQSPAPERRPVARPRAAGEDGMKVPLEGKARAERPPTREGARRERLMRLFNQLSAEEQEQLLQRLELRFTNRRRQGSTPDRVTPKPPADPDRVKVPAPEDDK